MYVYIRSESNLYTAGFYSPDGEWHAESDHESATAAAGRVNYLNGGIDFYAKTKDNHALATQILEISRDRPGEPSRINLIKILRDLWGCGLSEAKDKVEELFIFGDYQTEPTIRRAS